MTITYENTSKSIELSSGVVHYHEAGQGPSLLLIHGSGPGVTGWANFQHNLPVFSRQYRCIVVDLPGYGESDVVEGDPIASAVSVCVELINALELGAVHIIGNSLGGIVGSYIAADHPALTRSFTTIGGIGLNLFSAFPGEGLNLLVEFAENPTRDNIEAWLKSMVYDQSIITDELIDARLQKAIEPTTLATTQKLYSREAIQAIADFRQTFASKTIEHLSRIQAPTLVTWGRDDRVSPMDIGLLPMRLIPNCQMHVFPQCGHWAMIECKEQFEVLVSGFMGLADAGSS